MNADQPRRERDPVHAYVALGANLGDASCAVQDAIRALGALPDTQLLGASKLYRSAPHEASGPDFINAVACLSTRLTAFALLDALQSLEQLAGRQRPYHHAPRTLDLDVLRYGSGRIESSRLMVPHPRMMERAFVLLPLQELAPALVPALALQQVASQPIWVNDEAMQ